MSVRIRLASAVVVAATLLGLVAADLWNAGMRSWWGSHSFTGDVISSLLVVGVTALIFDELIARRQRKVRAVSVAVQALIVYGQARRVYDAVVSSTTDEDRQSAGEDLRSLATMLLTAGPAFFDDPQARQFLEGVERLAGSVYRAFTATVSGPLHPATRERLEAEMTQLTGIANPLLSRIPTEEWALADRPGQAEAPSQAHGKN
jgi:hypothetical protein